MSPPAKVLWLAKGLGRGGAERLLVSGAAHLDRSRFEVEVAYLLPYKDAFVPELRARGLAVHCLEQRSGHDLSWVRRLRRLVRDGDFDLVHTHMPIPAVAARIALGPSGPALVHTEHNVWGRYRKPTYWANALTFRRNDAVIAVSSAVRESMTERLLPAPPATVEVLLHGIEHDAMHAGPTARAAARALLSLPADAFVVGNVANFTPKKDQASLLEAFRLLRDDVPSARLVLIGTGPLEQQLRARALTLGLSDAVIFTGSRDDVPELLPALDVFCLSSLHEGLSIALVEAMASGVPAVCTAVGGVPEAMRDGVDGLLVPASNPVALAAALGRLAAEPETQRRFAANARTRSQEFDMRVALLRIEEIYDDVLARR